MILILHTFFGAMALCLTLPYLFKEKIGWTGYAFWAYALCSTAWVSFSPWYHPDEYLHYLFQVNCKMLAIQSLFLMATIPPVVAAFTEVNQKAIVNIIKIGLVIDAIFVLYRGYGIGNVGTLDAGVIAACLPLFFIKKNKYNLAGFIICVITIIKAKSATSALVLLAIGASYGYTYFGGIFSFGLVSFGLLASYLYQGQHFLTGAGRIQGWTNYLTWLFKFGPYITGTGFGTFSGIAPYLDNGNNNIWLYLHNDWLEILFDGGIIGLVLAITFYFSVIKKARPSHILFNSLLGFGVCCLTYSPLHMCVFFQCIFTFLAVSACRNTN